MADSISELTAAGLRKRLAAGELGALDVAEIFLEVVAAREDTVHAFAFIDPDLVRSQARDLDSRKAAGGTAGVLFGVPVALKDIIDTDDMPTENGTKADLGRRPDRDAELVSRLRLAGANIIGKTVTAELAHREPGATTNPHNPAYTPGGSSSGSAAAVAAGMAPIAVGTQTGGSVIRPAAYCGVFGFKPSVGVISTEGVFRRSHTLDTIGVFARSIEDIAYATAVLASGRISPADAPASGSAPKFAMVRQPGWDRADADMQKAFMEIGGALGGDAAEVRLPELFDRAADMHRTISLAELSHYAGAYLPEKADGLSQGMRDDIATGATFPAVDYIAAVNRIAELNAALDPIFDGFDAIVTPSATGQAPRGLEYTGDAVFCSIWTMCGTPAISLPLLSGDDGLPMGLQLVGRRGDDAKLLRTAQLLWERLSGRS